MKGLIYGNYSGNYYNESVAIHSESVQMNLTMFVLRTKNGSVTVKVDDCHVFQLSPIGVLFDNNKKEDSVTLHVS